MDYQEQYCAALVHIKVHMESDLLRLLEREAFSFICLSFPPQSLEWNKIRFIVEKCRGSLAVVPH